MVDAIIKELDADKSGTISLNELLSYAHEQLQAYCQYDSVPKRQCDSYWGDAKVFLTELFNQTDRDGSGEVTKKELEAAIYGEEGKKH